MSNQKLETGPHKVKNLFDLEKYPEFNIIWGIFVDDGCVTGEDPLGWRDIDAHAHSLKDDEWQGWICIANPRAVVTSKGRPTHTLIHEVAHLILQNTAHNKKWADIVIRLGGAAEAKKCYKPRVKKVVDVKNQELHDGDNGARVELPEPTKPELHLYQM
jgi:hypothetical protein